MTLEQTLGGMVLEMNFDSEADLSLAWYYFLWAG